jgi:hypothetical protein
MSFRIILCYLICVWNMIVISTNMVAHNRHFCHLCNNWQVQVKWCYIFLNSAICVSSVICFPVSPETPVSGNNLVYLLSHNCGVLLHSKSAAQANFQWTGGDALSHPSMFLITHWKQNMESDHLSFKILFTSGSRNFQNHFIFSNVNSSLHLSAIFHGQLSVCCQKFQYLGYIFKKENLI